MLRQRQAARLLLLDDQDRVLLFQYARSTGARFWATPGGGVEPGETFEQAARRELQEELGVTGLHLREVWTESTTFPWNEDQVEQEERYFLARLPPGFVLHDGVAATHRAEGILAHRWWSPDALAGCTEPVYPERLAAWLGELSGASTR